MKGNWIWPYISYGYEFWATCTREHGKCPIKEKYTYWGKPFSNFQIIHLLKIIADTTWKPPKFDLPIKLNKKP